MNCPLRVEYVMNLRSRAEKYIGNIEGALRSLHVKKEADAERVVKLAKSYALDAAYYLEREDYVTSIACSSYAEGLLDALRMMGLASFEWSRREPPTVLVGGVFEVIHVGHLYMLRKARELGRVVVVVARDSTVERLKGRKPIIPEDQRLEVVKSIKYVDKACLGSDPMDVEGTLKRIKPNIVLLGPDQHGMESLVRESIKRLDLNIRIVKLKERVGGEKLSSSSIISRVSRLRFSQS